MSAIKWISVIQGQQDLNVISGFVVNTEKSPIFYQQGPNGGAKSSILKFTLSRKERYKNKEGNWVDSEHTQWFNVIAFGEKADTIYPVLKAATEGGSIKLSIPFIFENKKWEKDGREGYSANFIVSSFVNVLWCTGGVEKLAADHGLKVFGNNNNTEANETEGF